MIRFGVSDLCLFFFSANITITSLVGVGIISNNNNGVSDNRTPILINGYELPAHMSHSSLTTFLDCGHKYYLSRVVNAEEPPAWWFVGGNAVHKATENFDREYPDISILEDTPDTNFFLDAFEGEVARVEDESGVDPSLWRAGGRVSRQWPEKENGDWWYVNGPGMVDAWVKWRQGCGWKLAQFDGTYSIEIGFRFEVGDALLQMYLDRLMVNEHGELVVVDLKSGANAPKSDLQLALYAYGCEKMLGVRPKWGTFWKARDGVTTQLVDLDKFTNEKIEYIVSGFDKLRKSGIFLPNLEKCDWCGFKDMCEWSKK